MASTNTVLASTLQRRSKGYLDVVSKQMPLFGKLRRDGMYQSVNGGTKLEWAVEYKLDTADPSYDGFDDIDINPEDNVVLAEANWKQYAGDISISGKEKNINSGQRIFNLLEQKEQNALNSIQQSMNEHFYLDGTGNSSKRVTGLDAIIPADPTTGTLFNINRATNTWWRSQNVDTNASFYDETNSRFTMADDMENLRILCGRLALGGSGKRYPNFIIGTETYYQYYIQGLRKTGQRFISTDTNEGDASFSPVKFHGAELVHDQDCPADAGSDQQAYFINTNYMSLKYHPAENFTVTPLTREREQNAFYALVLWMGELTSNSPAKHGLHEGVQAL